MAGERPANPDHVSRSEHALPLGPGDGRYCGSRLPGENGTIVSTRSAVFLQFRWEVARTLCHHLTQV